MPNISKRIDQLRQTVTEAALNYEIWWIYRGPETSVKYADTMNRYPILFRTAINAHFVAMLVPLYRLFETRKDSHNIPQLLKQLRKSETMPDTKLKAIEKRYQGLRPTWLKIATLRNEAFGHRPINSELSDVFRKASITPKDIRVLIDDTQLFLNEISREQNNSYLAFDMNSGEDAINMLEDLRGIA